MSRPSRYGPKSQAQTNSFDKNGPNGTDAAAAAGLNKARAQFNEPIVQLQAIFPDWKEEDLISVLEEVRGDVELAVARISDGHAEQWGAVKHKKEKKQQTPRERERERDGQGHHTGPRGASSPRGRGGRGGRGAGPHSGSSRQQHRDRPTNGSSPAPAAPWAATSTTTESTWPATTVSKDSGPEATDGTNAPGAEIGDDPWAAAPSSNLLEDSSTTDEHKPEDSIALPSAPTASANDSKPSYSLASAAKPRGKPGVSGLSWAQVAKPVPKPLPPSVQQAAPPAELQMNPTTQESVPDVPEPTREEPTTVEAPTWDDDVAPAQPLTAQPSLEQSADGWVDANPASSKSETDSWTDLGPQQKLESASRKQSAEQPSTTQNSEPTGQQQETPALSHIQQPTPDTFSPPPGLANPALSSPAPPKPTTPSNSRPTFGAHRPSSRFKTDQAVVMPSPSNAAGFTITKTIPLQFGSLNLSGDDSETLPPQNENTAATQQPMVEQKQAYANGPSLSSSSLPTPGVEATPASQPALSPASAYRMQGQQQQLQQQAPPHSQHQEEPQAAANPNTLGGAAHAQAPANNPALALAPGPAQAFSQHQHHLTGASHHTLAGLTHTPQQSLGLGHSHHPSFGQQASFPPQQQQQYEGATAGVGVTPFSGLGQSPQGQSQAFFRQTDSPFYNQSHTPVGEHGFSGGSAGGFGQGIQTGFTGAPSLVNDFGYEGQRGAYDNYSSQNAFAGRGALRQDDVKGLGGSPGQGLSGHHGNAQPSPLTGQPSGGQGQGQYPGMGHMGNAFYYNMNMNPYGYPNSFYPPTFTPFVNPMYQAGAQTPPHGAKPGTVSSAIGASGNSGYSANSSAHLQHASGGFDGDNGPNGSSTYHHPGTKLPGEFQKGPYTSAQGFLGGMSASSGVGANRGPGNAAGIASGGVGSTNSPETAFKGYGGSAASALGPAESSLPTQAGRGAPGVNQGHQQFYQNNRYSNAPQTQGGYPQQQQGDSYYSYSQQQQRW